MSNFSTFFPSDQKKSLRVGSENTRVEGGLASYLLRVLSKLGSGQGPSLVLLDAQDMTKFVNLRGDFHNFQWDE